MYLRIRLDPWDRMLDKIVKIDLLQMAIASVFCDTGMSFHNGFWMGSGNITGVCSCLPGLTDSLETP